MSSKVDVIIPCYNGARWIDTTFRSALGQTFRDLRVLAIDDGSTDDTPLLLNKFSEIDSRVQVVRVKHMGRIAAKNAGVSKSTAEYVAFLDSDDLWDQKKLEIQLAFMEQDRSDMSFTYFNIIDQSGAPINRIRPPKTFNSAPLKWLFKQNWVCLSTVVVKRRALIELKGFDESLPFCEDYDLWLRAGIKYKVRTIPHYLACWRKHADNIGFQDQNWYYEAIILKKVADEVPSLRPLLHKRLADNRFWRGIYWFGKEDFKKSRLYFAEAAEINPIAFWPYVYYLSSFTGKTFNSILKLIKRKLRDLIYQGIRNEKNNLQRN